MANNSWRASFKSVALDRHVCRIRSAAMQLLLIVLVIFHVVPGVFWAGSTFVLARSGGQGAEQFAYPQLGAATVSMLAGLALWGFLHGGAFGRFQQVLALGVVCAVAAAGVQSARGLPALRRLRAAGGSEAHSLRSQIAQTQRIAAGLLTITVICMVIARYV
jgi:hypothetical protein